MRSCPLCNHSQAAGNECEVCGKVFATPGGTTVSRLDGLEPTREEGTPDVASDKVPGLEATLYAPVEVEPESVPDVQPTQLGGGETIETEVVPDLEPTASEPLPDERTPVGPVAVCRYCRTPGQPGEVFCGRCGMRLATFKAGPATTKAREPATTRRCPACGTPNLTEICTGCGGKVPNS